VLNFHEKPDREQALQYIAGGDCLWNSGIFVWKASAVLRERQEHAPDIFEALLPVADAWGTGRFKKEIEQAYAAVRSISIDSGVLERAACVFCIRGDFGWNDIGSWGAVYDACDQDDNHNVVRGDVYTVDSTRCLVQATGKTVAVVGLDNVVIVETADALLVCRRDRCQDVRAVVEQLEKQGRTELL
jgi:mannose-1-phosphate guanylyltransferase